MRSHPDDPGVTAAVVSIVALLVGLPLLALRRALELNGGTGG